MKGRVIAGAVMAAVPGLVLVPLLVACTILVSEARVFPDEYVNLQLAERILGITSLILAMGAASLLIPPTDAGRLSMGALRRMVLGIVCVAGTFVVGVGVAAVGSRMWVAIAMAVCGYKHI